MPTKLPEKDWGKFKKWCDSFGIELLPFQEILIKELWFSEGKTVIGPRRMGNYYATTIYQAFCDFMKTKEENESE